MLIWLCFWVQSYCKSSYHGAGQPWSGLMLQVSFRQNTNDAKVCHSLQLHSLLCCWSSHDELPVKQTERSDRCAYLLHGHQSSPIHTNWRVQSKDCILKQSKTRPCTTAPSVKVDFNIYIYIYLYIYIHIYVYIYVYVFQSDSMGDHDATSLHLLEEKKMLSSSCAAPKRTS